MGKFQHTEHLFFIKQKEGNTIIVKDEADLEMTRNNVLNKIDLQPNRHHFREG